MVVLAAAALLTGQLIRLVLVPHRKATAAVLVIRLAHLLAAGAVAVLVPLEPLLVLQPTVPEAQVYLQALRVQQFHVAAAVVVDVEVRHRLHRVEQVEVAQVGLQHLPQVTFFPPLEQPILAAAVVVAEILIQQQSQQAPLAVKVLSS